MLHGHFRRQRKIAIAPDLSHRRTQLDAPRVRPADATEAEAGGNRARGGNGAQLYAWEIASDYSYTLILIARRFLTWLWTRLYDGVEIGNLDTVTGLAPDHEIIYVPCHRSHIDYLLLSYVVFNRGLMVPHASRGREQDSQSGCKNSFGTLLNTVVSMSISG